METAEEAEGSASKKESGETREDMLSRHRQELAKLLNKEISLKKAAARGSKAEQRIKKKQVEEEMSRLQSQLKAEHKRELSSLGYKTNGSTEKDSLDILVKAIAGVNVTAHGDSAKPSKGARRRERRAQEEAAREQRIQDEQNNMISDRMIENERLELKLEPLGLTINEIKPDGHCLYRAVEDQLSLYSDNNSPYSFLELRKMAANYMKKHATDFLPFFLSEGKIEVDSNRPHLEKFEKYCEEVETTAAWGGHLELGALTHCLKKHIIIYSGSFPDVEMGKEYKCENGIGMSNPSIMLSYHRHAYGLGEHYNSVVPNTVSGVPKRSNYGVEYGSSKFSVYFPWVGDATMLKLLVTWVKVNVYSREVCPSSDKTKIETGDCTDGLGIVHRTAADSVVLVPGRDERRFIQVVWSFNISEPASHSSNAKDSAAS